MSLDGKVILVTGAASGIGAATVALIRARGGIAIATDLAGTDTILDVTSGQAWDKVIAAPSPGMAGSTGSSSTPASPARKPWSTSTSPPFAR